ncbi:hypothetical protein QE152_g38762 [Popillia japonica]|uniref:Uncharacterized protein n=1 Tax=Popillia japonica TaxID=7064 RepID=A0AAW1HWE8_POPJA
MIRVYEAAKVEALEFRKKLEKKDSHDRQQRILSKIQINSQDENDITLERKISLRRRYSAGITTPQQIIWTQRRHSLQNSGDLTDFLEEKLRHSLQNSGDLTDFLEEKLKKYPLSSEDRRELMKNRKCSQSEEKEEEEFERVRSRMLQNVSKQFNKKKIEVADLSKWDHLGECISESSEDERSYDQVPHINRSEDEEDSTYHPTMHSVADRKITNEPFEILTKPNKLPDPNFVPKPILKRVPGIDLPLLPKPPVLFNDTARSRSPSPFPLSKIPDRRPSSPTLITTTDKNSLLKRGSLTWSAPLALAISDEKENK